MAVLKTSKLPFLFYFIVLLHRRCIVAALPRPMGPVELETDSMRHACTRAASFLLPSPAQLSPAQPSLALLVFM